MQFVHQTTTEFNPDLEAIEQSLLQVRAILDKLRALTRYETKPYVGRERILDLDRSSNPVKPDQIVGGGELIG